MQYKIPQDVQLEDKIVGPITMKQLGICAAGGSLSYFFYITLAKTYYWEVWIIPVGFTAILTISIAFIKILNLTFTRFVLLLIEYNLKARKRFWIKGEGLIYPSILRKAHSKTKQEEKIDGKIQTKMEKNESTTIEIKEISKILDAYPTLKT